MWVYSLALFCLIWTSGGNWEPPIGDAITFKPGGYAYVEDNGDFDPIEEGMTIEAWILIEEPPRDYETQVVIEKPGSYAILLRGRLPHDFNFLPKGATFVEFFTWDSPRSCGGSGYLLDGGKSPVGRWMHLAFQIIGASTSIYIDGWSEGIGSTDAPTAENDEPLFIGGIGEEKVKMKPLRALGDSTFRGMMDEMRISRGLRYPFRADRVRINPERRFKDDSKTIALWHFDKILWGERYPGTHGHVLKGVKTSLAIKGRPVRPRGKLATIWGEVKR